METYWQDFGNIIYEGISERFGRGFREILGRIRRDFRGRIRREFREVGEGICRELERFRREHGDDMARLWRDEEGVSEDIRKNMGEVLVRSRRGIGEMEENLGDLEIARRNRGEIWRRTGENAEMTLEKIWRDLGERWRDMRNCR